MIFKVNIAEKTGNTYKLELDSEILSGKQLRDVIQGKDFSVDLDGYEFEITGASDKSGFPSRDDVEGIGLGRVLLTYGKGMRKRPKGGKKKVQNNRPKGLRLRKTVRGKVLSDDTKQVNLRILKEGTKKLSEVFPDQNKKEEKKEEVEETTKEKRKKENKQQETESAPKAE